MLVLLPEAVQMLQCITPAGRPSLDSSVVMFSDLALH